MSEWSTQKNWENIDSTDVSQLYTIGRQVDKNPTGRTRATGKPKIKHVLIIKESFKERVIDLDATTYSIGRHPANSIPINDPMVSRQHALLLRIPKSNSSDCLFRIIDGNLQGKKSQNGICINGQRRSSHDLRHEDVITFSEKIQAIYHQIKIGSSESSNRKNRELSESTIIDVAEQERLSNAALVRLSSFPEMTPHPILELDAHNVITYLNPAAEKQFPGIREKQEHPVISNLIDIAYSKASESSTREVRVGERVYEQYIHCIPQSRLVRSYLIEITERCNMQVAVQKSEERYALAARGANDGLWDWDINKNTIYLSPRWKSMIGYEEFELSDSMDEWLTRIHPDDVKGVQSELNRNVKGAKPFFECEFRLKHRNGDYRYFRSRGMVVFDSHNQALRMAGSQTDITEYNLAREQLLRDAFYDAMTSLPNRVLLLDRMSQALKQCKRRENEYCAVLFIDLNRFKLINDSLGHIIGDKLLVEVSKRLQRCIREGDTIARLGGDEFVVLMSSLEDVDDAKIAAQRIHDTLKHPFNLAGREVFSSASIGIAMGNRHYEQPEDLLRDADVAMHQAKEKGKDSYAVFQSAMHKEAITLLDLENDLRRAIERNELQLFYQPIIDLKSNKISAFEALLRWQHPTKGLVAPSDFIPLAEETGLIIPIGSWLLRDACQRLYQWQQEFPSSTPLSICVNISSRQFAHHEFVSTVESILEDIPVAYGSLKLEITEGVIMRQPEMVATRLTKLKDLGVKLSVDDFGTGYSSLSYLQSFPVDTLKVDRSFVMRMGHPDSREIVKTIVMLAHNLGLDVVAEGVETEAQAQLLKAMDCEFVQGYYYSRPIEHNKASQMLQELLITPD